MARFRVGIDSYCLHPLKLPPGDLLGWVAARGGEGVQFSEVHLPPGRAMDEVFLRELAADAAQRGMYLEWGGGQHVPFDAETWRPRDLFPVNGRAAEQARTLGASVVRSCSGGFFRWHDDAPPTDELVREVAVSLRGQRSLFEDNGVTLAIELHFEFTTFELLRLFDMCDAEPGGWLGVCLDTLNMLPMAEDPVAGTRRILPWVVATHIKDGAVALGPEGLVSFPTELGCGVVDLPAVLELLATLDRPVNLSVEDHGGQFTTPLNDPRFLPRLPDLTVRELTSLMKLAHTAGERLAANDLAPTERADWPEVCAARTEADVRKLRELVAERGEHE